MKKENMHSIKFDIPTNFDSKFIEGITKYNSFTWVYGKMNNDLIGGGRPSIMLPLLSWKKLKEHIDVCHAYKIKFNYLINALCLENKEVQKPFHRKMIKFLDKLNNLNIDGVTVASPYLCRLIKRRYPHLFVSISIYNHVKTLSQIKYWQELGADEITLFHTVNRDFDKLRMFLEYTKDSPMNLRIIANNTCLHECPYHANHAVCHSHASKKNDYSSKFHIDYYVLKCNNSKIKSPTQFISSEWIRPEDIHFYEKLCNETDNHKLTIKLTERGRTTEWLLRTAEAYNSRSYEGNLLDIVNYFGNKENKDFHVRPMVMKAVLGRYNIKRLLKIKSSTYAPFMHIDNKKLDGFINKFVKNYDCNEKFCDDIGWENDIDQDLVKGKGSCSYCRNWAEKVISFDKDQREEFITNSDSFIDDLELSNIFYLFN